jgi:NhaA family Na+:H+ antiporter
MNLAKAPAGVLWKQTFGASCLCGIGFTMSLFIATLAFTDSNLLDMSKIGTLSASIAAAVIGGYLLAGSARLPSRELQPDELEQ